MEYGSSFRWWCKGRLTTFQRWSWEKGKRLNETKFWNQIEIWEMLKLATRSGQGLTKSSDQILVPDKNVLPKISNSMRRMRSVCFFNNHAYNGKFSMLFVFFNFLEDLAPHSLFHQKAAFFLWDWIQICPQKSIWNILKMGYRDKSKDKRQD